MVAATRPDDVRNQNRRRVLSALRRSGGASRTDIGKWTGLSAATVSAITSDFLNEGVLVPPETENVATSGRGRPKVALMVNPDAAIVCSVYFELNAVSAAMLDYSGTIISECAVEIATDDITSAQIKRALIECVDKALIESGRNPLLLGRIAVGFQGVTDVGGRTVLWTPLCDQRHIPVKDWLEARFGVPTRVANDCDMIAQALIWRKPEKFGPNFGAILLAHGVGMGLYLRSGIVNGTQSSALEFGHMKYVPNGALCRCGNRGCIEAYAGDYAISRNARDQADNTPPSSMLDAPDLDAIANAARNGDAKALAAIESAGAAIGSGLASLYALVDAFPIVLVGRGAALFDLMETPLRAALATAPGEKRHEPISIDCYPDERPLVREGCAISALLVQDDEVAARRSQFEAVS